MFFLRIISVSLFLLVVSKAKVLNKDANTCEEILGPLVEEIRAYEDVKDKILNYVLNGDFKRKTYDEWVYILK